MLDNTFDEEYYRLENTINTNFSTFHTDREGKLLLTHPIFGIKGNYENGSIQQVLPTETGVNILPENVNLIIDSVDLFSTNPLCQNYLPLRIAFGRKPVLEYTDITFTQLDSYKVIADPLLPIDTFRNHRYSSPVNYSIFNEYYINSNFRRVVNNGNFTGGLSPNEGGTGVEYLIQMVAYVGGAIAQNEFEIFLTELVSRKTTRLTIVDFQDAVRIVNIYPSNGLCLVLCEDVAGFISIYDITLDNSLTGGVWLSIAQYRDIREVFLTDDNEFSIVITINTPVPLSSFGHSLIQFNKTYDPANLYQWTIVNQVLFEPQSLANPTDLVGCNLFYTNRLIYLLRSQVDGKMMLTDVEYLTASSTPLRYFDRRDITNIIGVVPNIDAGLLNNCKIYVGGKSIKKPNISIFFWDTNVPTSNLSFYNFPTYDDFLGNSKIDYNTYSYVVRPYYATVGATIYNFFLLKRYFNQAYFQTYVASEQNTFLSMFCLDEDYSTDKRFVYTLNQLEPNKIIPRFIDCISFSASHFIVSGGILNGNTGSAFNTAVFSNQRLNVLESVFKMSYNYVERTYPFKIEGNTINFSLSLPNSTPIADMEIFKYIIDIRIRYSKTKAKINEATPADTDTTTGMTMDEAEAIVQCEEDCGLTVDEMRMCQTGCKNPPQPAQECKLVDGKPVCEVKPVERGKDCLDKCGKDKCRVKCNRNLGSASRVLGLVGEDFSVVDFLNLYTAK